MLSSPIQACRRFKPVGGMIRSLVFSLFACVFAASALVLGARSYNPLCCMWVSKGAGGVILKSCANGNSFVCEDCVFPGPKCELQTDTSTDPDATIVWCGCPDLSNATVSDACTTCAGACQTTVKILQDSKVEKIFCTACQLTVCLVGQNCKPDPGGLSNSSSPNFCQCR